jgi:D-aminopeptidase
LPRARDHGIIIGQGTPGAANAITDVPGVRVGHRTLSTGSGPLIVGRGPVRTGVTVILPPDDVWTAPVFAGAHRLNGNGEMTGLEWVRESGMLTTPVALTNTHSVGVVRDALLADRLTRPESVLPAPWALPVVAETWDGLLNDLNGFHVRPEHVAEAIAAAEAGAVSEGAVGAGTGMICHGFKGGIGTASRVVDGGEGGTSSPRGHTVGVLVLANHGRRERLAVNGVGVAPQLADIPVPPDPDEVGPGAGSIIVVVATDAPLLPHQCTRLAQRAGLGIARTGGVGEHTSGDLFLCFASGNRGMSPGAVPAGTTTFPLTMLADAGITPLFDAVVEATEEAIVNALVAAPTTEGRDGIVAHGLSGERLAQAIAARAD